MSETNMGRVPVGDPIPLRFDPKTKQRLEELAADIGPRRFGALVRVAARRLLADPDRVTEALAQARRASADARRIPWAERPLDLDPATNTRLSQLAHEFHTDRSAIVRVALHRFLTAAGRFRHPVLREDTRTDLPCRTRVYLNRSTLVRQVRSVRASSRSTGCRNRPAAVRKRCTATRTIALRSVWNSRASWLRRVLVAGSRSRGRSAQGMRRASAEARRDWFRASGTRSGSDSSRRAATRTSAPKRRGPMPAANSSSRRLVVGSNRSGIGSPTGTRPMLVSLITDHCSGPSGDLDSHPNGTHRHHHRSLRPGEPVAAKSSAPQHPGGWVLAVAGV